MTACLIEELKKVRDFRTKQGEEDKAQMVDGYAAANFSILRSFVINLFRHHGFDSLTRAIRQCAHNIQLLFSFLE